MGITYYQCLQYKFMTKDHAFIKIKIVYKDDFLT